MFLHNFWTIACVLSSFQLLGIYAYPMLNIPLWFGNGYEGRYKKNDFPQAADADVIELEHLKQIEDDDATDSHIHQLKQQQQKLEDEENTSGTTIPKAVSATRNYASIKHADLLPELERELELLTVEVPPSISSAIAIATEGPTESVGQVAHRPPMLTHNDDGKMPGAQNQTAAVLGGASSLTPAKPFYGAARLAFGQNPEVLPTSSTTSTTTTIATSTTNVNNNAENVPVAPTFDLETRAALPTTSASETSSGGEILLHPLRPHKSDEKEIKPPDSVVNEHTKESIIADVGAVEELKTLSAARRSKTVENLLRHDGEYSSFDMAQYVFWSGDEAGVAHAVEEFIEQGLMTRENALKFLREIRLGIEYLQKSYANRVISEEEMQQNKVKKIYLPPSTTLPLTTTSTTTSTTTTTEKPFPYVHLERSMMDQDPNNMVTARDSGIWNKLQELNKEEGDSDVGQDLSEYDETTGRAKIAAFLYTEYTLEEILYKLAKVMFTQSLAHGSNEAQLELQKLTDFLEREGNRGVIPIDLQKKVLHVLLSALSDTLREHPGLLPAARLNLNLASHRPMHSYGTLK